MVFMGRRLPVLEPTGRCRLRANDVQLPLLSKFRVGANIHAFAESYISTSSPQRLNTVGPWCLDQPDGGMKHVHLEKSPREGLGEGYAECACRNFERVRTIERRY